ncbi:helix-turn-helix domain-containing protein [Flagellimonas sp.]|uniref:helix-turn-helix domain-containing protein n=1 Tax=Flagellimonas sp. TaxID=2058762 RepID=UPI003B517663
MENPFKSIEEKLDKLQYTVDELQTNNTTNHQPESDLLDVKQASKMLKLAEGTIYNMAIKATIPSYKKFGKRYFLKSELLNSIKEGKLKTKTVISQEVDVVLCGQKNEVSQVRNKTSVKGGAKGSTSL